MTTYLCRKLSAGIIGQAVLDWRFLIDYTNNYEKYEKMKVKPDYTFTSLREFFKSDWCLSLCEMIDPKIILDKLEAEKAHADKSRMKCKGIYFVKAG